MRAPQFALAYGVSPISSLLYYYLQHDRSPFRCELYNRNTRMASASIAEKMMAHPAPPML